MTLEKDSEKEEGVLWVDTVPVILALAGVGGICIYCFSPYLWGFWNHGITRNGGTSSRKVALTFDDGPDPRYTTRCLDILKAHQVCATFFLVGEKVKRYPELAQEIRAQGHDVGNHTWGHRHHWLLSPKKAKVEVREGAGAIMEAIGEPPRFFRPPYGMMNLFSYREAVRLQEQCVLGSIPVMDWRRGRSADWIIRRITSRLRGGAIVLLHDSGGAEGAPEVMLRALPDIIHETKRRGFQLVSLSEMMDKRGAGA